MNFKKYLSEFLGTYILVFCGTGSIIVNDISAGIVGHIGISLVFGLVVMAMVYSFGEISGAHLNPAVSIGFWLAGRFPAGQLVPYIAAQLMGGLAASASLALVFEHGTLGATIPKIDPAATFILELAISYVLMQVIINVSTGSKETGVMAGIAVGGTVGLAALFCGPVTGASMNPARSLAPALLSGHTSLLWIYLLAPVAGAALAVLGCRGVRNKDCCCLPGEKSSCEK